VYPITFAPNDENHVVSKNRFFFGFFICYTLAVLAQVPEPDKSPMDMSYAPHNYPILKFQGKVKNRGPLARIVYSRPQKDGRELFGKTIKYGEIWRLGANEATEIEFFTNVTLQGKKIPKGRYTLYCIPQPEQWTLIVNKDLNSWGAFSYQQTNDLLRVVLPVKKGVQPALEFFTMFFNDNNHLIIAWDDVRVEVPFEFVTLPK
jgi:hypothetical protein